MLFIFTHFHRSKVNICVMCKLIHCFCIFCSIVFIHESVSNMIKHSSVVTAQCHISTVSLMFSFLCTCCTYVIFTFVTCYMSIPVSSPSISTCSFCAINMCTKLLLMWATRFQNGQVASTADWSNWASLDLSVTLIILYSGSIVVSTWQTPSEVFYFPVQRWLI